MKRFLIAQLVMLFILSSCIRQHSKKKAQEHNNAITSVFQQEAMLVDIPIPLYDERILVQGKHSQAEQNATMLGYRSSLLSDDIIEFYMQEMERLGWRQVKVFKGIESLLQFESPGRLCTISVRENKKRRAKTDILIFTGTKT